VGITICRYSVGGVKRDKGIEMDICSRIGVNVGENCRSKKL